MEPYLLYQAITLGYRFKEEAVTKIYPPKAVGYTKMTPVAGWWSILRPLVLLPLGLTKYPMQALRVPFVDLKAQYHPLKEGMDRSVIEVLEGGGFVLGQQLE